jgi:hypothetical protein
MLYISIPNNKGRNVSVVGWSVGWFVRRLTNIFVWLVRPLTGTYVFRLFVVDPHMGLPGLPAIIHLEIMSLRAQTVMNS